MGARKVTRSGGETLRLRGVSRSPGYHQRRPCPQPVRRPLGWGGGRGATAAWVQRAQSGKWGLEGNESLTPSSSSQKKRISNSTTCHVLPIPFSYQSLLQFTEHLLGTCCIRHSSKALQTFTHVILKNNPCRDENVFALHRGGGCATLRMH